MTKFKDVKVGETFDFVDNMALPAVSFWNRCTKLSARQYAYVTSGKRYIAKVGSINVQVFNVYEGERHG